MCIQKERIVPNEKRTERMRSGKEKMFYATNGPQLRIVSKDSRARSKKLSPVSPLGAVLAEPPAVEAFMLINILSLFSNSDSTSISKKDGFRMMALRWIAFSSVTPTPDPRVFDRETLACLRTEDEGVRKLLDVVGCSDGPLVVFGRSETFASVEVVVVKIEVEPAEFVERSRGRGGGERLVIPDVESC